VHTIRTAGGSFYEIWQTRLREPYRSRSKWVVDNVAPAGTSIGGYITRVMEQHYADNWERMMAIYEEKLASRKKPLENASFIKHNKQ
jgi:hypothetical protein